VSTAAADKDHVGVSVIIPSFQSAATIRACLRSVLSQNFEDRFEVFVADSGSDDTADIVRREFPTVRLLKSPTRLSAELARNWGAREASGSILGFIDSDCVADRDWLARLCATLQSGICQGIGGAIRPIEPANATAWAGYFCEFREFLPRGEPRDATYLTPNNAAYWSDVFRGAGGFPDGYFPLEDQMFYQRLCTAGAHIRLDPTIVVAHTHRTRVAEFLVHQGRIGDANARVVRALDGQGAWIASHPAAAAALMPALALYRFARTIAACWRQERCLLLRRPAVAGLCFLGMCAWSLAFARASTSEPRLRRLATE
jgi:glycosyltransferase involved in cell wall biosynthesis